MVVMVFCAAPGERRQNERRTLTLYDYQDDPLETRNLAANKPEVVAELRAILAKHPEAKPQVKGDK